jgi:hypothetical protein
VEADMAYFTQKLSLVLAVIALSASPGMAESHFIFELNGGVASDAAIDGAVERGTAGSATFGIGGKIPGQSPAYYLVGRIGGSEFGYFTPGLTGRYVQREQKEWALGGRVYLPITDRLRAIGQLALGETLDDAYVTESGAGQLGLSSSTFSVFAQGGVQFRVTEKFALGLAADIAIYPQHGQQDLAVRSEYVGNDGELGRVQLGATGTFHF